MTVFACLSVAICTTSYMYYCAARARRVVAGDTMCVDGGHVHLCLMIRNHVSIARGLSSRFIRVIHLSYIQQISYKLRKNM